MTLMSRSVGWPWYCESTLRERTGINGKTHLPFGSCYWLCITARQDANIMISCLLFQRSAFLYFFISSDVSVFLPFNNEPPHSETNKLSKKPLLDLCLAGKIKLVKATLLLLFVNPIFDTTFMLSCCFIHPFIFSKTYLLSIYFIRCLIRDILSVPKNWCFWTMMLENTLESPLDCKEIKPVNPYGN